MSYLPPLRDPVRTIGRRTFDFDHEIVVMGIVNRTPDSSSIKGVPTHLITPLLPRWTRPRPARAGLTSAACHFSPDAQAVTLAEEIDRVVPGGAGRSSATSSSPSIPSVQRSLLAASRREPR